MSDLHSATQDASLPPGSAGRGSLQMWLAAYAMIAAGWTLIGATWLGAGPAGFAFGISGLAVGVALVFGLFRRGYEHPTLGACNLVTMTRLGLTAAVLAPLASGGAPPVAVFALAAVALTLDGVDGWLARREGRVSDFGARLDMEVDSALALLLAVNAVAAGTVGAAVVLIGLPRYVFAAALLVWPWLDRPLPDRFSRKAVCVVQIAGLMALQLPAVAGPLAQAIVALTAAALAWSFGRDVLWLRRAGA